MKNILSIFLLGFIIMLLINGCKKSDNINQQNGPIIRIKTETIYAGEVTESFLTYEYDNFNRLTHMTNGVETIRVFEYYDNMPKRSYRTGNPNLFDTIYYYMPDSLIQVIYISDNYDDKYTYYYNEENKVYKCYKVSTLNGQETYWHYDLTWNGELSVDYKSMSVHSSNLNDTIVTFHNVEYIDGVLNPYLNYPFFKFFLNIGNKFFSPPYIYSEYNIETDSNNLPIEYSAGGIRYVYDYEFLE
jgi:hypothetical protein